MIKKKKKSYLLDSGLVKIQTASCSVFRSCLSLLLLHCMFLYFLLVLLKNMKMTDMILIHCNYIDIFILFPNAAPSTKEQTAIYGEKSKQRSG